MSTLSAKSLDMIMLADIANNDSFWAKLQQVWPLSNSPCREVYQHKQICNTVIMRVAHVTLSLEHRILFIAII